MQCYGVYDCIRVFKHMLLSIKQTAGASTTTQQTQSICMTFVQRRPNVFDVGPTICLFSVLFLGLVIFQ